MNNETCYTPRLTDVLLRDIELAEEIFTIFELEEYAEKHRMKNK